MKTRIVNMKMLVGIAFCFCVLPLSSNESVKAAPQSLQSSHWYYCSGQPIDNLTKDSYFSDTFSSAADGTYLEVLFEQYVEQRYGLKNGLMGLCGGLGDTRDSAERHRQHDMSNDASNKRNVIQAGWAGVP